MALAKTVTKMFPMDNEIGIILILTDDDRPDLGEGVQVVVKKTFKRNVDVKNVMLDAVQKELEKDAQKAIDDYKAIRARYDTVYGDKISKIDTALKL